MFLNLKKNSHILRIKILLISNIIIFFITTSFKYILHKISRNKLFAIKKRLLK